MAARKRPRAPKTARHEPTYGQALIAAFETFRALSSRAAALLDTEALDSPTWRRDMLLMVHRTDALLQRMMTLRPAPVMRAAHREFVAALRGLVDAGFALLKALRTAAADPSGYVAAREAFNRAHAPVSDAIVALGKAATDATEKAGQMPPIDAKRGDLQA